MVKGPPPWESKGIGKGFNKGKKGKGKSKFSETRLRHVRAPERDSSDGGDADVCLPHLSDGHLVWDDFTVVLGNLPGTIICKEGLVSILQQAFGTVSHVHIHQTWKFAYVNFENPKDAEAAIDAGIVLCFGVEVEAKSALAYKRSGVSQDDFEQRVGAEDGNEGEQLDVDRMAVENFGERPAERNTFEANLREKICAVRDETLKALETQGCPQTLSNLGAVTEIKRGMQALYLARGRARGCNLAEICRGFPSNFTVEDKPNGQHLIHWLSSATDDVEDFTDRIAKASWSEAGSDVHGGTGGKGGRDVRHFDNESNVFGDRPSELSDGFMERDEKCVKISQVPRSVRSTFDVADAFKSLGCHVIHIHIESDRSLGFVHFSSVGDALRAQRARLVRIHGAPVEVRAGVDGNARGVVRAGAIPVRRDHSWSRGLSLTSSQVPERFISDIGKQDGRPSDLRRRRSPLRSRSPRRRSWGGIAPWAK